jgi:hypothetical protein
MAGPSAPQLLNNSEVVKRVFLLIHGSYTSEQSNVVLKCKCCCRWWNCYPWPGLWDPWYPSRWQWCSCCVQRSPCCPRNGYNWRKTYFSWGAQ